MRNTSLILSFFFVLGIYELYATTYYSTASGAFNVASTWSTASCGGAAAASAPGAGDDVVVCNGYTVNVTVSTPILESLVVQSGGRVSTNPGIDIYIDPVVSSTSTNDGIINGRFTLNLLSGATYTNNGTINVNNIIITSATYNNASGSTLNLGAAITAPLVTDVFNASISGNTVVYARTGVQNVVATTYHHLQITASGTKSLSGNITINGNLDITGTAQLDVTAGNYSINLLGNWNVTSTDADPFVEQNGTVTFSGSGANTLTTVLAGGETFYNMTFSKTTTNSLTLASDLTISNLLNMNGAGTFNTSTYILQGGGGLTATNGDLQLSELYTTAPGLPRLAGSYNVTGGTISFNGAGNQLIRSLNTAGSAQYYNITLDGSGTKSLNGAIVVAGNWINNSVTLGGSFAVNFNGGSAQTIGGTGPTIFYDVITNNSSTGISLSQNVTATNGLTMTNGLINLGSSSFKIGTTGGTGTLNYTAGWFYSLSGTPGALVRPLWNTTLTIGDSKGFYPVGSDIDYRPVWVARTRGLLSANVSVKHIGVYPATYDVASHNDATWSGGTTVQGVSQSSWVVDKVGSSIVGVGANAPYVDIRYGGYGFGTNVLSDINATLASSVVGTFAAATNVVLPLEANRTDLSQTELYGGAGGQYHKLGTRNTSSSPLPVELLNFEAKAKDKVVELSWTTASETINDYFTIERSKDGETFEAIAKINGAGTSSSLSNYSTADHEPFAGISYYRLKQTDLNGNFKYYKPVAVYLPSNKKFGVYPNPTNNQQINLIATELIEGTLSILIYNSLGKVVYSEALNSSEKKVIPVNFTNPIPAGIYFLKVSQEDKQLLLEKIIVN